MGHTEARRDASRTWPVVAACGLVAAMSLWLARLPPADFVTLFPDDAYFYMKTAWHAARGSGTTFDGINLTNGYHPLYLGLLTALSSVVPLVDVPGMLAVFWLDTLLSLGWLVVMGAVARSLSWTAWQSGALMLGLLPIAAIPDFGMEPNVLMPLAWAYVVAVWRHDGRPGRALAAGLLGALACLARLDSALFVGLVALSTMGARGEIRWPLPWTSMRTALLLVGPSVAALAGYSAVNLAVFGRGTSVSSWLKMGPTAPDAAVASGFQGLLTELAVAGCVAVALIALGRAARARRAEAWRLAGLAAWLVAYQAILALFLRGGIELWYFPLPLTVALLIGVDLVPRVFASFDPRATRAALGLVMVGGVVFSALLIRGQVNRWWLFADGVAMGRWIDAHLPPDAVVYEVDNAGLVGYFAGRPLINGDGLINGWDYQRDLRSGRLPEYLRRTGVGYLVSDEYEDGAPVQVRVPLWDQPALTLSFAVAPVPLARHGRFILVAVDHAHVRVSAPARPAPAP